VANTHTCTQIRKAEQERQKRLDELDHRRQEMEEFEVG
jgi:hypothetical protein